MNNDFYNFLDSKTSEIKHVVHSKAKRIASNEISALSLSSPFPFFRDQVEVLSDDISNFVTSDDFFSEFCQSIDDPYPNESEDEFVARCKRRMKSILMDKFK
jgi:hypothetical protein